MTPTLTVIAGPNGSGKSTLTEALRASGIDLGEYINPDEIAATLVGDPDERTRHAQRIADERRAACLEARRSFSFETVMSHTSKLEVMHRARELGYRVVLYFVGLEDPRLNIARVRQRVDLGGHPVSPDKIVSRYERCMMLLPSAFDLADVVAIFDNSVVADDLKRGGLRLAVHYDHASDRLQRFRPRPPWVSRVLGKYFEHHARRKREEVRALIAPFRAGR